MTMSNIWSVTAQSFPPKAQWGVDHITDLTGKVVIVTGGNTGIGWETIKALLNKNAKVYLGARSEAKGTEAIQRLRTETGREAIFLQLDLADLKSVRRAVEEFTSKQSELHLLFNNAGVMFTPMDKLTAQGYDLQFGTNVLGHFFFTKLLLPTLVKTAQESQRSNEVRIINTSSSGHYLGPLNWNGVWKDGPARDKMSKESMYFQSKFGNVVMTRELARRYASEGIISHSVNPGNIQTDLQRDLVSIPARIVYSMLEPTPTGALTQLYAGTSPEAGKTNGAFFIPWARLGRARKETGDAETGRKLWDWLEEQCIGF